MSFYHKLENNTLNFLEQRWVHSRIEQKGQRVLPMHHLMVYPHHAQPTPHHHHAAGTDFWIVIHKLGLPVAAFDVNSAF